MTNDAIGPLIALFIAFIVFIFSLYIIRKRDRTRPEFHSGKDLDDLAEIFGIEREYYGADILTKPNSHCYWEDDYHRVPGWYENDYHLKGRIKRLHKQ